MRYSLPFSSKVESCQDYLTVGTVTNSTNGDMFAYDRTNNAFQNQYLVNGPSLFSTNNSDDCSMTFTLEDASTMSSYTGTAVSINPANGDIHADTNQYLH